MIAKLDLMQLLPEERAVFKQAARLGGAAWFRRFAVAVEGAAGVTRLDLAVTPYLREPLDCVTDAHTREIGVIFPTQTAKTTLMRHALCMLAENAKGDLLFAMPTDEAVKEWNDVHFTPTLLNIESLRNLLPMDGTADFRRAVTLMRISLPHCHLFFTGIQKPGKVKSRPIWVTAADEIDEMPTMLGEQGDPLELLAERQRTYEHRGAKSLYGTTPTTERGHGVMRWRTKWDHRRYYVPCPHCGAHGVMAMRPGEWFGGAPLHILKFPRGATPGDFEAPGNEQLAHLECWRCKGAIHSHHKPAMLARGRWVCANVSNEIEGQNEVGETIDDDGVIHTIDRDGNEIAIGPDDDPNPMTSVYRTRYAGWWINCFYSPWLSFNAIAAKFLQANKQGAQALKNFVNSWLAEPWHESSRQIMPHMIRRRVDPTVPRGVLPAWAKFWVLGVDTQTVKSVFKWVKIAFGDGRKPHLFDYGETPIGEIIPGEYVSEGYKKLEALLDARHRSLDGALELEGELGLVDTGGGRELDLYEWCERRPGVMIPIKGIDTGKGVTWSTVEYEPLSGRAKVAAVKLALINTQAMKDLVYEHIAAAPESAIAISFFAEMGAAEHEHFLLELTREEKRTVLVGRRGLPGVKDERSMWQHRISGANDSWDALVYAYAGAYLLRERLEAAPAAPGPADASMPRSPDALPSVRLPSLAPIRIPKL